MPSITSRFLFITSRSGSQSEVYPWTDAHKAMDDDNQWAYTTGATGYSQQLRCVNMETKVPTGNFITGIQVRIERASHTSDKPVRDHRVQLYKEGVRVGVNKAKDGAWPSTPEIAVYGGNGDLWGESWTVDNVNSDGFGVGLVARLEGSDLAGAYGYVDFVSITVWYSPTAPPPPPPPPPPGDLISNFTTFGVSAGAPDEYPWLKQENAYLSDDKRAESSGPMGFSQTYRCTNLEKKVPSNSYIKGIAIRIERCAFHSPPTETRDHRIRLYKGGVLVGDDKAVGDLWPETDTYVTYGGENDLWGTTWTVEEVNASGFGVGIAARLTGWGPYSAGAFIDHVEAHIWYAPAPPEPPDLPPPDDPPEPEDDPSLLVPVGDIRGHVVIDGKPYVLQDESYVSQIVPMFRPQLQVSGITREALDQYLYMVWSTWDRGSNERALLGRWVEGSYSFVMGLDTTQKGKLSLQPLVEVSLSVAESLRTILLPLGSRLYAFMSDGSARSTTDGKTWTPVTYDHATLGVISCAAVMLARSPYVAGSPPGTSTVFAIAGTTKGKVISFPGTDGESLSVTVFPDADIPETSTIRSVGAYRNMVVATHDQRVVVYDLLLTVGGTWAANPKYRVNISGVGAAQSVFDQVAMIGAQSSQRGSTLIAVDAAQAIDSYPILGAFVIQSMATWRGNLLYAGFRPGPEGQGEVYAFPEKLLDVLPKEGAPPDVLAILPLAKYALVGWNKLGGLWWVDEEGAGPFCKFPSPMVQRYVRSIALFDGVIYYSLDTVGVVAVSNTKYERQGLIRSGWFDGGFPELMKNFADVQVRLDAPLRLGEEVILRGRVNTQNTFTDIGTLKPGASSMVFRLPSNIKRGHRIELEVFMTGPGRSTPVVTAVILRYVPLAVPKRVWGFTVRAEAGLTLLDGTRETRSPGQIISDLFALRRKGEVEFASVLEPYKRKVYCNNVSLRSQLMGQTPQKRKEEAYVHVELLEV